SCALIKFLLGSRPRWWKRRPEHLTKYLLPLGRLGGLVPHEGRRHSLEPGAGDDRPSIGTVQGDAEFVGIALLSEPDGDPPLRFQEDAGHVQALGTQLSE